MTPGCSNKPSVTAPDILCPQRWNPTDFGDLPSFSVAPPCGSYLVFSESLGIGCIAMKPATVEPNDPPLFCPILLLSDQLSCNVLNLVSAEQASKHPQFGHLPQWK